MNLNIMYVGHHVGSVTVRVAVPNTYKKIHEDKTPFDAICLVCEKPNCERGECLLVGGKDIMDKNKKAAKTLKHFDGSCNRPLGNEQIKDNKKTNKSQSKNGGNRNE